MDFRRAAAAYGSAQVQARGVTYRDPGVRFACPGYTTTRLASAAIAVGPSLMPVRADEVAQGLLELRHRRRVHVHHVAGIVVFDADVRTQVRRDIEVIDDVFDAAIRHSQVEVAPVSYTHLRAHETPE